MDSNSLAQRIVGYSEVKAKPRDLMKALFAEFVGTLFIVLVGCGSSINFGHQNVVQIALAAGVIVATAVQITGHVSGGHLNPAVTLGMLVIGKTTVLRTLLYIIAQCLGSIAGAGILKGVTPTFLHAGGLGQNELNVQPDVSQAGKTLYEVSEVQGLAIEFFITFILILTVCAVCDPNRTDVKGSVPLAIGLAVAACHLFALPYTGSSMNPARTLGPAIFSGYWDDHWVYWLGPCAGGMTAAILYHVLFSAKPVEFEKDNVQFMQLKTHGGDKEGVSKGLMQ